MRSARERHPSGPPGEAEHLHAHLVKAVYSKVVDLFPRAGPSAAVPPRCKCILGLTPSEDQRYVQRRARRPFAQIV
jgi:hypothetical protein